MVSLSDITLNNTSLAASSPPDSGPTAVFAGCTQGIGLATLHALVKHTAAPTCYLIGRSTTRLASVIEEAKTLNSAARLYKIVVRDLTLVREAQRAAEFILNPPVSSPREWGVRGAESETQEQSWPRPEKVDLLFLSQGYLSFSSTPSYSNEGLDRITSIRYHARMRLIMSLLPVLRAAPSPRIISVLAAGQEGTLHMDDLGMTDAHRYGAVYAAGAASAMTTLFFERLVQQEQQDADGNKNLVLIHLYPGVVAGTGLIALDGPAILRFLFNHILRPSSRLFAYTATEAGERVLFAATNGRFRRLADPEAARGTLIQQGTNGVFGSGVYGVKADSSVVVKGGTKALRRMREEGAAEKVWEYTLAEFERIERLRQ